MSTTKKVLALLLALALMLSLAACGGSAGSSAPAASASEAAESAPEADAAPAEDAEDAEDAESAAPAEIAEPEAAAPNTMELPLTEPSLPTAEIATTGTCSVWARDASPLETLSMWSVAVKLEASRDMSCT